jgi:hypothetical protein
MSARTIKSSDAFQPVTVKSRETVMSLSSDTFQLRKNGIEFQSQASIPEWTEMTVDLEVPGETRRVHCNGIVVACNGNRHAGYKITMLFTGLSKQAEARLSGFAVPQPH